MNNGPQYVFLLERCQPGSRCETTFWALEIAVSILYIGSFPHLDSVFHFIVDYLLEAVASMRLGFHFIGVGGDGRGGVSGQ